MRTIQVKNNDVLIDDEDFDLISSYNWFMAGYPKKYIAGWDPKSKNRFYMHRFLMGFPESQVDHVNGNTLDNRRSNLRICSHAQNMQNRKKSLGKSSIYKGVYFVKRNNSWIARINDLLIGEFKTERQAALAYDLWSAYKHKSFSKPNFEVVLCG